MSAPVKSVEEFLSLVRRSGLVDEPRLAAVVEPWAGHAGLPPEPLLEALVAAGLLTRWQIDQLLKGKYKGFLLGKYRLLKLLGSGGMSSVYLAEHVALRSKAAVKVLPRKRVSQTSYLERFEQEARLAARLNHPNIIRTFDLDTAGAVHYIAMEYVEGTDLHAKVKREGPLPVRQAADYIRQAATGLEYAHEEGLVHRDVKPANLMLDVRGTIKVLDLGLALAVAGDDGDSSLTREHNEKVLGTADYLAPEQATDSHKADARSDIYSLGCTLYYLLVGSAPFAAGNAAARMQAHLHKPAPNLLERRPDVPIAIADLFFRMVAKQPEARPQSARDVAASLAAWLDSTGQGTAPVRLEGPRRPLPRRPVTAPPDATTSGGPRGGSGVGSSSILSAAPASGIGGAGTQAAPSAGPPPPAQATVASPAAGAPTNGMDRHTTSPEPAAVAEPATPRMRRIADRVRGVAAGPLGIWIGLGLGAALILVIGLVIGLAVMVLRRNQGY